MSQELETLLDSLFETASELRRFLKHHPDGPRLLKELPEGGSKADVFDAATTRLIGWGMADAGFFDALRVERPGRAADIDRVAATLVRPDPESALRALITERISELPAVFELPGQRPTLTDIYVELTLNPESLPKGCEQRSIQQIQDVLHHPHRRWVLLGEAGCGKTTLLHHLAATLLAETRYLPVPLRVAELQRNDHLSDAVERAYDAEAVALVTAACRDKRAVILLDGLDEAVQPDDARAAVQRIAVDVGASLLLVSSRDTAYARPGASFGELRVMPLSHEQQVELLGRRLEKSAVKAELSAMSGRLARMAKNPLLLTIMGMVLQEGGKLPQRRAELYESALSILLEGKHRVERKPVEDPPLVREVLARLALKLHGIDQTTMPLEELRKTLHVDPEWGQIRDTWRNAPAFLETVARISDLLLPESSKGVLRGYRFPHRTFREYLASVALVEDVKKNGLGGVSDEVLKRVARGEPAETTYTPTGELGRVLPDATQRPDIWAEVLALTAGALAGDQPDQLVRCVAAAGDRRLLLRVVADAEGLKPETVDAALAIERGWEQKQVLARKKILEDLPSLVGDPAAVVSLLRRFIQNTTDGNDLYWARESLRAIAAGRFLGAVVEPSVQAEAAEGARRVFAHIPEDRRKAALDLLRPWWRTIPAGRFVMGSPPKELGHSNERPRHKIHITRPFQMLGVPVTWEMYQHFDPGHAAARNQDHPTKGPVYRITWYAAMMFAEWVGARLPWEAEWEYAARARTTTRYWSGDTEDDLERVGWYDENSGDRPHAVAELPANAWGLHDVHGNVYEWCLDRYDRDGYTKRAGGYTVDPAAAADAEVGMPVHEETVEEAGTRRVLRGGAWLDLAGDARAALRGRSWPTLTRNYYGFRLACLPPE